ncbi:hypothetical protein L6R53_29980 [Myxococcota bacterium]|nr:hypothetical protein [Myxococcota bacterium]
MAHPVLVLVDPDDGRRQRFGAAFQRHFELYSFASADLAASAAVTMRAGVVVAHMEQHLGDGLDLCAELRAASRGWPCLLVVHGQGRQARERGAAMVVVGRHGADLVLPQELEPGVLLRAVARRLKGFALAVEEAGADLVSPASRASMTAALPTLRVPRPSIAIPSGVDVQGFFWRLDRHLTWPAIRQALLRPRTPLIEDLPEEEDFPWSQALLARASGRNLRVVLAKPVTPLVRRLPVDRRPSWREVLRAEVNAHNLRVLLGGGLARAA